MAATRSLMIKRKSRNSIDLSLQPISNKKQLSSFNRWSQHEPILTCHTDHWSKLRCKSYSLRKLPTRNFVAFCKNKDTWLQTNTRQQLGLPRSTAIISQGTLAPVGSPDFNKYLVERLHNPHIVHPRAPSDSRGYNKRVRVPSASSQRAKNGCKYWPEDKTRKLSSRGKTVTLGSKGTFLGIGIPRL